MIKTLEKREGITLIALVITIIILLILAGVAVGALSGDNGILNRAAGAKERTERASLIEQVQTEILGKQQRSANSKISLEDLKTILGKYFNSDTEFAKINNITDTDNLKSSEQAITLTSQNGGYTVTLGELMMYTNAANASGGDTALPTAEETTPWLPTGATVTESDLSKGVTVTKGETEWTWVVVPKSVTANAADDTAIETALRTYCTNNGVSNTKKPNLTDNLPYTYTDEWYSEAQSGMSQTDYNNKKSTMLNSIKNNGGFWIGKYEVGYTEDPASNYNSTSRVAKIIQNAYPYNYVTCSQAEGIAESLTSGLGGTGSLMFGIRWDLALVYLKLNAGVVPNNSTSWGNHNNKTLTINSDSAYQRTNDTTWPSIAKDATSRGNLLTTGAAENTTNKLNIVDLAGNVYEWTLEKSSNTSYPCVFRGGYYDGNGASSFSPASYRSVSDTTGGWGDCGLRPTLY